MTNTKRAPARTAEQRIAEIYETQRRVLQRKLAAAEKRLATATAASNAAEAESTKRVNAAVDAMQDQIALAAQLAALDAKAAGNG